MEVLEELLWNYYGVITMEILEFTELLPELLKVLELIKLELISELELAVRQNFNFLTRRTNYLKYK